MKTKIFVQSLGSAKKDMTADEELCQKVVQNHDCRFIRLYLWPSASITYSYKQTLPPSLAQIPSGQRVTGGGLVFHNPGDLTLAYVSSLNDPIFSKKIKEKMHQLSDIVRKALQQLQIDIPAAVTPTQPVDYQFCTAYPNPYELYFNRQKVLALTLRKYRSCFVIQGIIHLQSNHQHFARLPKTFHPYFTAGLSHFPDIAEPLRMALMTEIYDLIETQQSSDTSPVR